METLITDFNRFLKESENKLSFIKQNLKLVSFYLETLIETNKIIELLYKETSGFNIGVDIEYKSLAIYCYERILRFLPEALLTVEERKTLLLEQLKEQDALLVLYLILIDALSFDENEKELKNVNNLYMVKGYLKEEVKVLREKLENKIILRDTKIKPENDLSLKNVSSLVYGESIRLKATLIDKKAFEKIKKGSQN